MTHRIDLAALDGSTALVLGAAGFLGSHLCDRLLDLGATVIGVDSLVTSDGSNIEHLDDQDRFTFIRADIIDTIPVHDSVDFVAHLASPASPPDYLREPLTTLRTGSIGTDNALRLAAANGARFLLASTSEVYGDPEVHPQTEAYWGKVNPIGPRSVYDEAKRYAEAITMAYRRAEDLDVGIARIFNTYGPRMRIGDGRAIPNFFAAALAGEPLPVHGDGSQTRSLCYVSDMTEGLVRLLASDLTGPVNLGNTHEVTMLELAEAVQQAAGRHPGVEFRELPVDDPVRRRPDTTLAAEALGWSATVDLASGLEMTKEWFEVSP
ncbi:MAG: NAD-dependent epimerase/dehydratase family protein [Acidimicrobiia bacterium]